MIAGKKRVSALVVLALGRACWASSIDHDIGTIIAQIVRSHEATISVHEKTIALHEATIAELLASHRALAARLKAIEDINVHSAPPSEINKNEIAHTRRTTVEGLGSVTSISGNAVRTKTVNASEATHTSDLYITGSIYWHGQPVGFDAPTHAPTPLPSQIPTPFPTHKPTPTPVWVDEPLASMSDFNFCNSPPSGISGCDASFPALTSTTFTSTLVNGYTCLLSGWSHTRTYANGLLRNSEGDSAVPKAIITGLISGFEYTYRVYQYDSGGSCGSNYLSINGGSAFTTSCNSVGGTGSPTASGRVAALSDGTITFTFTRVTAHVDLSALSIAKRH